MGATEVARGVTDAARQRALIQGRSADAAGATLLGLLVATTLWSSSKATGARPGPVLMLIGSAALTCAIGRRLTATSPWLVYRLVAGATAAALLVTTPDWSSAGGPPIGYANANATLAAIGAVAAMGAATQGPDHRRWLVVAAGLTIVVGVSGSAAAAVATAAAVSLALTAAALRQPVATTLGGAIIVVLALDLTLAVALGGDPGGLADRSGVRGDLWRTAADIAEANPGTGVGPAAFAQHNALAADPDLRWAHHGYLQLAAEQGLVGMAALLGLVGWAYTRLDQVSRTRPAHAILGATALTLVALHATVDHVLHHPPVVLSLTLLFAAATATPRYPESRGSSRPPP